MVAPQGTAILVTHHNVVYSIKLLNNFFNIETNNSNKSLSIIYIIPIFQEYAINILLNLMSQHLQRVIYITTNVR